MLALQQEIHDLVQHNTHQAHLRQMLKCDCAIRAKAYKQVDLVWVFCRYVPQKDSPKVMRAWRGSHRVAHVLQDYLLDNGQKVRFECLKRHHSGPTEIATTPFDTCEIAVVMDPEHERSIEPINDDLFKPSY